MSVIKMTCQTRLLPKKWTCKGRIYFTIKLQQCWPGHNNALGIFCLNISVNFSNWDNTAQGNSWCGQLSVEADGCCNCSII